MYIYIQKFSFYLLFTLVQILGLNHLFEGDIAGNVSTVNHTLCATNSF